MKTGNNTQKPETYQLSTILDPLGLDIDIKTDILLDKRSILSYLPEGKNPFDVISDAQSSWLAN